MYEKFIKIRGWAHQRNLIHGSTPNAQFIKLMEEAGELAAGLARQDESKVIDSIGDMVVVLTIMAEMYDFNIEGCIEAAYDEIKDRKGKMVDGVFVKEADII
jgi:NTP pyrophosphatase (non-canonical NTP hydrolase)